MIVFDNLNPISENYKPSVIEYTFPTITFKKNWTICTKLRNNAPNLLIFFHSTMFMTANNFWRLCSGLFEHRTLQQRWASALNKWFNKMREPPSAPLMASSRRSPSSPLQSATSAIKRHELRRGLICSWHHQNRRRKNDFAEMSAASQMFAKRLLPNYI